MEPILSIIIPCFGVKGLKYMDACRQSLRNQTFQEGREVEIIVINNGCRGVGGARNIGLSQARGAYVLFVDADDELLPYTLLASELKRIQQQKPDMVSYSYVTTKKKLKMPGSIQYKVYNRGAKYVLHNNFLGTVWRHIIKRSLLEEKNIRFSEFRLQEDEIFILRCYLEAKETWISKWPIYFYRQVPYSNSHNQSQTFCDRRFWHAYDEMSDFIWDYKDFKKKDDPIKYRAMKRRLAFLTIDQMKRYRTENPRIGDMETNIRYVADLGLLPLPLRFYGIKYLLAWPIVNLYALYVYIITRGV